MARTSECGGKKPNVIYILAEDIGWGELGWQGGAVPSRGITVTSSMTSTFVSWHPVETTMAMIKSAAARPKRDRIHEIRLAGFVDSNMD